MTFPQHHFAPHALTHAQDFEGQRLAEMLSTVLLGAAGVRFYSSLRAVSWW